jgi:hypothetical protein
VCVGQRETENIDKLWRRVLIFITSNFRVTEEGEYIDKQLNG